MFNHYNKNTFLILTLIALMLQETACKKYVEIPPPDDKVTAQSVYTSAATIASASTGLYEFCFEEFSTIPSPYSGADIDCLIALAADDAISPPISIGQTFYTNTFQLNDGTVQRLWSGPYLAIGRINDFISGVQGSSTISEEMKTHYISQARLMRAYYYFNLTNLFGDVPLPLSGDVTGNALLPRIHRLTVDSVIISDMLAARDNLTATEGSDNYTFNQNTANALLARMYGYKKDWTDEETAASAVINSGRYSLEPDLTKVFDRGNPEAIYQVPNAGNWFDGLVEVAFDVPAYILTMTPSLVSSFEPGDKRLANWTAFDGTNYTYNKYTLFVSTQEQVVIRLADVILLRAEARAELNNLDGAIDDLNMIRERAGVPDLPHSLTQDQVIQAMMSERRKELFAENITRWFDLSRWGIMQSTMSAAKPNTWKARSALFPVVTAELNLNPNLKQTPGY